MKKLIMSMMVIAVMTSCKDELSLEGFQLGEKYDAIESMSFETNLNGVGGEIVILTDIRHRCYMVAFNANSYESSDLDNLVNYANHTYDVNLLFIENNGVHLYYTVDRKITLAWEPYKSLALYIENKHLAKKENKRISRIKNSK